MRDESHERQSDIFADFFYQLITNGLVMLAGVQGLGIQMGILGVVLKGRGNGDF